MDGLHIRRSTEGDVPGIEALYPAAFPDEDLLPLVRSLLREADGVVSLVAEIDSEVAGNIVFTLGSVAGTDAKAALLAPLAVTPARHRQRIGSELVSAGMAAMREAGVDIVCVLGDPAYYGRFGFATESDVEPPYALPDEWLAAWQSQYLNGSADSLSGQLTLPAQWLQPELWLP